jgi:2-keto-4-pentenoate hydratase/2-oxohepta-3-ene-1,7-dioic acid hydratase in catechol pathway
MLIGSHRFDCPGKIVCIGLNYRDHTAENGLAIPKTPVVFSKFSNCVIAPSL